MLDLILVGAGLANGLIALALMRARPEIQMRLVEGAERAGGDHTWSFHETDLTPDYFLRETDEWLVFPHELDALTPEELERHRPEIASIVHGVKARPLSA